MSIAHLPDPEVAPQDRPVTPAEISAAVDAWHFTRELTLAEIAEWAPRLAYLLACLGRDAKYVFTDLADGLYDRENFAHPDTCDEGGERAYGALSFLIAEAKRAGAS